jgi:hypothetical protein
MHEFYLGIEKAMVEALRYGHMDGEVLQQLLAGETSILDAVMPYIFIAAEMAYVGTLTSSRRAICTCVNFLPIRACLIVTCISSSLLSV